MFVLLPVYFSSLQHYASRHGHSDVCKLLLSSGADPNTQTPGGVTPLHRASYAGHVEVVRLLLGHGATVLLCDSDGRTALHKVCAPRDNEGMLSTLFCSLQAAEGGMIDVIKLLVTSSPSATTEPDKRGKLPRDLTRDSQLITLLTNINE